MPRAVITTALCLTLFSAAATRAEQEEGGGAAADVSWVDGPEPPGDDDDAPASRSPREPGVQQEELDTPEVPDDPWVPKERPLRPAPDDLRMSTVLDRDDLTRFGDVSLADPLLLVPGLLLPHDHARAQLPSMRGLAGHTQLRVDGVPILPGSTYPDIGLLGAFDTAQIERVVVRHGPRLTGIGGPSGAGGLIEIETRAAPIDRGQGLPLTGRLVGAMGGPDIEKALVGNATVGFGRARVTIVGGGFDVDPPSVGRDAGLLTRYDGAGGHVGTTVDVVPFDGLRVFGSWRSVRHKRGFLPRLCEEPGEGEQLDCVLVDDLAFDLMMAGVDADADLFGVRVEGQARAHAQHHGEHLLHEGDAVVFTARTRDDLWRAGAVADVVVTPPVLWQPGGFPLDLSLRVGSEILRDRVESVFTVRSRRNIDAIPRGQEIPDPERARRLDDSHVTYGSLLSELRASFWRLSATAGLRVDASRMFAPAWMTERTGTAFVRNDGLAFAGDLALRARILDELAVFGALTRSQRSERLFARTLGPERFQQGPGPAPPLHDLFDEHSGELGVAWSLDWFRLEGVGFAAVRSGELFAGRDPIEELAGDAPLRLIRGAQRQATGVEGRAEVLSRSTGLSLLATAGLTLREEGRVLGELRPMAQTPGPAGVIVLSWEPGSWPFSTFARLRWTLPQARLSPAEAADPSICPELEDGSGLPCFGAPGAGIFDLGAALTPSDRLDLRVLVENVLDSPWQVHGYPLPGQGLGARFTATLSL